MNTKPYETRRRRLFKQMGLQSIAIVPTADVVMRNRDTAFPFRHDSDFFYLTGFTEPEAVAVFITGNKAADNRFILYCRERDPEREIWDGRRYGPQRAKHHFAAHEAHAFSDLDKHLPQLLENRKRIYYSVGRNPRFDERVQAWRHKVLERSRAGVKAPDEFIAIETMVHEMRLRKDSHEVVTMRRAAQISAQAHCRAMQVCRPGMMEYELEAEIVHEFARHGSRAPAYPSIVGGGANACILHYVENNAKLRDGDLVLIDAGAEYEGYAGDITRTFPINGRFSEPQRALYDLVLKAQHAAIAQVKPGKRWNAPHDAAVRVLTRGLVQLGLLKGDPAKLIKNGAYRRFYMHRTGHWLGMDVHDVGEYREQGKWRKLQPGMVLTVEPGLYVAGGSKGVAKKWWDIGIRIEDDVLVTRTGSKVLTEGVPKDPDEIERLMVRGKIVGDDKPAARKTRPRRAR